MKVVIARMASEGVYRPQGKVLPVRPLFQRHGPRDVFKFVANIDLDLM